METEDVSKKHAVISIGCPNVVGGGHAAFRQEEGKFICDCGKDFTDEMLDIKNGFEEIK